MLKSAASKDTLKCQIFGVITYDILIESSKQALSFYVVCFVFSVVYTPFKAKDSFLITSRAAS